ncbi:MAG: radical SAM protein [Salinivirgaceae bacterium]|jgi:MoaA/NifB/PqqE/SkfB family radical SAM enzyme|nr:radical SAM protein [Salinivirgaceae bacterium]
MIIPFTKRLLTEIDMRLLLKLSYNMGWKAMRAIAKYKKRLKKGELFPAFLMISVTDQCNLNCQGCWVKIDNKSKGMNPETLNNIINSSKAKGSYFFGILGGEPVMYPHLIEILEQHSDCYFQLFTNGTLLTDEVAKKLRKLANVTPLVSIEGLEDVSDIRRGADKVYKRSMTGIDACTSNKLMTGVATSVCKSNFKDLVSEEFVQKCIDKGIHYLWYYIYRPVGANPSKELALSENEILQLREFMVNARLKFPIMIVDTYWDDKGKALCPGAVGISHHINPHGGIELCPPIQFALDNVKDGNNLGDIIENSVLLRHLRTEIPKTTQGCILLDSPEALQKMVADLDAYDSSKRGSALTELNNMGKLPGHHIQDKEIPEKSWMYRFAKKNWFFGFGVYG